MLDNCGSQQLLDRLGTSADDRSVREETNLLIERDYR
jgi:hypothetical protein